MYVRMHAWMHTYMYVGIYVCTVHVPGKKRIFHATLFNILWLKRHVGRNVCTSEVAVTPVWSKSPMRWLDTTLVQLRNIWSNENPFRVSRILSRERWADKRILLVIDVLWGRKSVWKPKTNRLKKYSVQINHVCPSSQYMITTTRPLNCV